MRHPPFIVLAAALALTACGKPAATGSGSVTAALGGWKATDACSLVDKDTVAAATGSAVTAAELSTVTEAEGGRAAFSTCAFNLANGATLTLLSRQAPDGDGIDSSIEQARTGGGVMPPGVDVPGLGKAAIWTEPMKTLQVFIDDRRYITLSLVMAPAGMDALPALTAVAKKAS